MILLELLLTFLKVGAVSFGGGYAMISLIRDECLSHGWLGESELLNFIAVAESTPGPIAVNMATFVGSSQGGILGALMATLGVVLPSFVIILLIAAIFTGLMKYAGVKALLGGIKPAVIGLILGTAVTMLLGQLLGVASLDSISSPDLLGLAIFAIIAAVAITVGRVRKKPISPIILILLSGVLGVIFYGV